MALSKAEIKKLKALDSRKGRKEQNRFIVGGVRLLEEAAGSKMLPETVYFAKSGISARGNKLVEQFSQSDIPTIAISNRELNQISDTDSPQGILAAFMTPDNRMSKLYKPSFRRLLLCDRISDPGNLGTLARSALAFEFDMLLVTDKSVELFSPKVVRSSAGALFSMAAANISMSELVEFKVNSGAKIVAAIAGKDTSESDLNRLISMAKTKSPLILAIGGEAEGLSEELVNISDFNVSITHNKNIESLNAAVAGSILMSRIYESTNE